MPGCGLESGADELAPVLGIDIFSSRRCELRPRCMLRLIMRLLRCEGCRRVRLLRVGGLVAAFAYAATKRSGVAVVLLGFTRLSSSRRWAARPLFVAAQSSHEKHIGGSLGGDDLIRACHSVKTSWGRYGWGRVSFVLDPCAMAWT